MGTNFHVGDAARVRANITDPVIDHGVQAGRWQTRVDITDWQGIITAVRTHPDGRQTVTVEWDAVTLMHAISDWVRFWGQERCRDQRFGYLTLEASLLKPATVRDTPAQRAAERETLAEYIRWNTVYTDLCAAAGITDIERAGIDVTWGTLLKATLLPATTRVQEEGESEGLRALRGILDGRRALCLTGSCRLDDRLHGEPRTQRLLREAAAEGGDVVRVIACWRAPQGLVEQDVVVRIHA